MSVQPTETPGLTDQPIPVPEAPAAEPGTVQRNGFMVALAAAENIVSTSPVVPVGISVRDYGAWKFGSYGLDIHFAESAEAVVTFAATFDSEAVTAPNCTLSGENLIEARGVVAGVPFRAWALMPAPVTATATAEQDSVTA